VDWVKAIEIFALVSGVAYLVLEILQKNLMWVIGILTGVACAYSFGIQHVWASMGLNVYYVVISVAGLYKWRKDARRLAEERSSEGKTIHLSRMTPEAAWISLLVFVLGTAALWGLLRLLHGSETLLDAVVTMMSAIATWWLAKSYPQQWLVWPVADVLSAWLCWRAGIPWMALLYVAYAASALYGYAHWMKNGQYLSD